MSAVPAIVLVGPMGVGKSTVGQLLAERLGVGYRDTDDDIVAVVGRPVRDVFRAQGEAYFRTLERSAVRAALAEHDGVLALGGGAILAADTRALLTGLPVVFLDVGPGEAVRRMGRDAFRPLLAVNPHVRWRELMDVRRPLYESVARAVIGTGGTRPEKVAQAVIDVLELRVA
ncbi:shikimate kinase [Streptomyces sp. DG2A-72]|uniref:shikimate kinase n=1 Tax=Streptomyces sp. DG2A-72 TaxID=3051386 RepID=UPI00265B9A04|nr:shikimate kinase [Streptomyces sp. DG2A-72]MDO0937296.1 shikimate kinase [Streptomyces sp. DG2A-72]